MRRSSTLLGVLVAAAALASAAAAAAGSGVQLTEARGAKFPNRSFVVSLPAGRVLSPASVEVTENGQSVVDVSIVSASAASKKTFGVVLVVDTSESMAGAPVRNAMAAARAFAARRNPNQQLALVTFNSASTIALPFTTSRDRIDAALSRVPAVAYGTHINDAVATAEKMIAAAQIEAGSIVVLSDGADTGSTRTGADVAAAARAARVRLYTIGLKSPKFDRSTLASLAADGGGEFTLAESTQALAPVFDRLSERLAREYVLRYRSLAGPNVPVHVAVRISGVGNAAAAYETPALPVTTVAPYRTSIGQRFWRSPILMILFALLVAAAITILVYGFAQTRGSGLPERMVEFVSVPGLQRRRVAPHVQVDEGDPDAAAAGFWGRFDRALEIAQIRMTGAAFVAWTVAATIIVFFLLIAITGSVWWALLAAVTPFAAREFAVRKLARRRESFAEQLPDALQVISSALRSGHSFAGALAVVVESAAEPTKSELQRVVADEQLGIPLDESLEAVAERMASHDLEQVALVAELQRYAGGNAAEVVDRVAETIRERFELRRLIKTLTAQGRMSRWIVTAVPLVIILLLQIINPHYLHPLVSTLGGKIALGIAAALCVGGSLVIKKIIDIKV